LAAPRFSSVTLDLPLVLASDLRRTGAADCETVRVTSRAVDPLLGPPDAAVVPSGSKSVTNRALLCAALASGTSRISGVLLADDTRAMPATPGVARGGPPSLTQPAAHQVLFVRPPNGA